MSRQRDPFVKYLETLNEENSGEYNNLSLALSYIVYTMPSEKYEEFSKRFAKLDENPNTSIFKYPHTPSSWALPNAARRMAGTIPSKEEIGQLQLGRDVLVKIPKTDEEIYSFKLNLINLLWNYYYNKKYRRLATIIKQQFPELNLPSLLDGGYRRRKSRKSRKGRKSRKTRRS